MNRNRVFFSFASLLGCIGVFILIVPSLVTPDLIQPKRIDSLYMEYQRMQIFNDQPGNFASIDSTILFNPSDLGLEYRNFDVNTPGGLVLRGWFIPVNDTNANTILVLHDYDESKILKLNLALQMHDRGLNVCLVDLRAHGNSDGHLFSPGITSVSDVKCILDSLLNMDVTNHIAIFGSGVSAGIALQSALYDGRTDALVLQCPYNDFEEYARNYAARKWGSSRFIFYPILKRKLEDMMLMPLKSLVLSNFSGLVETPMLFLAAGADESYLPVDAYAVYDSSLAEKKDLFLIRNSTHENIELTGGEQYYNAIAEFINHAIPRKLIRTRNRKMT